MLCCQRTTKSIIFILESKDICVDVYIDDFFGAETEEFADLVVDRMIELFSELNLEASIEKDVAPTSELLCLGVWVNSLTLTLSVPNFRIVELTEELNVWLKMTDMSKRDVQRLLGKLSYIAACVMPGRPFMTALINSLSAFPARSSKLLVSDEIKED